MHQKGIYRELFIVSLTNDSSTLYVASSCPVVFQERIPDFMAAVTICTLEIYLGNAVLCFAVRSLHSSAPV